MRRTWTTVSTYTPQIKVIEYHETVIICMAAHRNFSVCIVVLLGLFWQWPADGMSARPQRTAAQLSKVGWDALNAGRIQEAATAFDEALRESPQRPVTLLGAAAVA